MKFPEATILALLKFFGDKQPHKVVEQAQLMRMKAPKMKLDEMVELFRYCIHNGWIQGVGIEFHNVLLGMRQFILTDKGDEALRWLSVKYGGDRQHFAYFDREKAKTEGSDVGNRLDEIQGAIS